MAVYKGLLMFGDAQHAYTPIQIVSDVDHQPIRPRGAFDSHGTLHAVWIQRGIADGRYHNYYAQIDSSGHVGAIRDLTAELGLAGGGFGALR